MDPIWHDSGMEREWIGVSNEMDLKFKVDYFEGKFKI
jgi:hypothetical protein